MATQYEANFTLSPDPNPKWLLYPFAGQGPVPGQEPESIFVNENKSPLDPAVRQVE